MDIRKLLFFITMPILLASPLLAFTPKPVLELWHIRSSFSTNTQNKYPFSQELALADQHRGYMENYNLTPTTKEVAPLLPDTGNSFLNFQESGVEFLTTSGSQNLFEMEKSKAIFTLPSGVYSADAANTEFFPYSFAEFAEPVEDSFAAHTFLSTKPELKFIPETGISGNICLPILSKNNYISSLFTKYTTIPLDSKTASLPLTQRALKYTAFVNTQAKKYNLNSSLILAIMHVESAFNPNAVSTQNAHGLMQIVLPTAGAEVHHYLGKQDKLSAEYLRNPETNISYGSTYLYLLSNAHFKGISNPLSKEYCVIAAYNGGSSRVFRVFGETQELAIARINSLGPQEIYATLVTSFPSPETRNYLKKVVETEKYYLAQR